MTGVSEVSSSYDYDHASQVSSFTYDDKGHLVSDGSRSYSWNLASRLLAYSESGTSVSFAYDALGQRVSSTAAPHVTGYVWNYAFGLTSVSVIRKDSVDSRYFIHTPDGMLLYSIDAVSSHRLFYHFDEIGNTIFLQ